MTIVGWLKMCVCEAILDYIFKTIVITSHHLVILKERVVIIRCNTKLKLLVTGGITHDDILKTKLLVE